MSLTTCLKKAGSALRPADKAAILALSRTYRADGLSPDEAAKKAIAEQIAAVQKLIASEEKRLAVTPPAQAPALTAPSQQDVLDQQARAETAAKSEKAQQRAADELERRERVRKDIAKASEAAADSFELGGDAEQNLSGQGAMFAPSPEYGYTEPNGSVNDSTQPDDGREPAPAGSAADDGVRGAGGAIQRRASITGLGIAADIQRVGSTVLIGREVKSAGDLAELAQIYRDPRYETFRVFFTKGDSIVHATGISARLPGQAPMMPAGMSQTEYVAMLKAEMTRTGADGYYILHNHPSGNPTPSTTDVAVTELLASEVPGMRSHVVINSNKFAVITPGADVLQASSTQVVTKDFGEDKLLQASKPMAALGRDIRSPDDLAMVGKSMQKPGWITIIGVSSDGKVRMVAEAPSQTLTRSPEYLAGAIRRLQRQSGATMMFAVGDSADINSAPIKQAVRVGILQDALPDAGMSLASTMGSNRNSPFNSTKGRNLAQDGPVYARKGFDADAFSRMFRPPTAMSVADVQKAVDQLSAKWKSGPVIKVVATPADLPIAAPGDARGLIHNGTAYVVAKNHLNRDGIARTLAHEAIGHYGLWRILGEDGKKQFERNLQLAIKSGNVPLNKIAAKVKRLYVDKNGRFNLSPAEEANEIAAFAVEDAIDPATGEFNPGFGFMKKVWADVAAWLRSIGIEVKFTNLELQGLLVNSMRGLEAGDKLDGGGQVLVAAGRGTNEAVTNPRDVVGKTQGGRSADDNTMGTDESTGLPVNADGTVTVYHHTSAAAAKAIRSTGTLKADAEPDVYVTTHRETDTGYGDTAVPIRVRPDQLTIDDEFPNGRKDFRLTVGKPGGSLKVDVSNESTAPDSGGAFARGTGNLFQPTIWNTPDPTRTDRIIFELQDNKVDLKRVQQAITKSGQQIEEQWDARLAETLYPGRVAYRSQTFLEVEAKPLLEAMAHNKVGMDELADYLHARGAEERNVQIAKVNPNMPDGGAGTNSKGVLLTNQAARDYLTNVRPARKVLLDAMAKRVDAITAGTRRLLVAEGLEKQDTIDAWQAAYKHYVPMFRDEAETAMPPHPQGSGFAVKGSASKRATGSTKEVTNILAHVLMQREAAITRAEKNRVALALYGQALSHPNPDFWTTIKPGMSAAQIGAELVSMGVDPLTAQVGMEGVPTIRTVDPITNKVVDRPNPMYKSLPGAIPLKVKGEDRVLMLNVEGERGRRLADSLKNLDGLTQLDIAGNIIGKSTRWLAAVNTQYNPAFGLVNLTRDVLGGVINLGSTELRGKALKVLAQTPVAILGIARELASGNQSGKWQALYRQFQADGGQTGFKENFRDPNERAKAVAKELASLGRGKLSPGRATHAILDLLDGFNTTLENAVRLSAYSAALDQGISRAQAARLGRELTVDFNRKGRAGREVGPLYAFFNASVQGSARTIQTLKGPTGTKIIAGGLSLGVLQVLMLLAAGYDDDEIPEFVKTRALIIPLFGKEKHYMAIPYPLGLHVLPNTGRVLAELVLNGGKDIGKRSVAAIGEIAGAFNPLGGGNILTADGALKTVAPTVLDPLIELGVNKNFAGSTIEKMGFGGETDNRPGVARVKESTQRSTTGQAYMGISKAINTLTGGNDYEAGLASPTPERVRYIAQTVGGGVLREFEKTINASTAAVRGDKVRMSGIPVAGRFYGEVDDDQVAQSRYFSKANELRSLESSLNAAKQAGDGDAMRKMLEAHPEAAFITAQSRVQAEISKLNKLAVSIVNDPDAVKLVDTARVENMKALNAAIEEMEKDGGKTTMGDRLRKAVRPGAAEVSP